MKLLIFGGRDYNNGPEMLSHIEAFQVLYGKIEVFISGGARGADQMAIDIARNLNRPVQIFYADWNDISRPGAVVKYTRAGKAYNCLAGHQRNQQMLDEGKPDWAMGFPGGAGTADMLRRVKKAKVNYWNAGAGV